MELSIERTIYENRRISSYINGRAVGRDFASTDGTGGRVGSQKLGQRAAYVAKEDAGNGGGNKPT